MADATMEYNLGEAKAQLERCEQNYAQLQDVARRSLDELATLRQLMQTIAQQVGVEVAPTSAPVRPTQKPLSETLVAAQEVLHPSGSSLRSSGSSRRSGDKG